MKMKRIDNGKNRRNGVIFLLMLCITAICSSNASAGTYNEQYDLNSDFVNGSKDSFYDIEYSSAITNISFAYSSVRYAIFIEHSETITSIQINGTTLSSNFADGNVIAVLSSNQAEIVLQRAYFGENTVFAISINNLEIIIIDPFDLLVPIITPTETTTTTEPEPTNTTTTEQTPVGKGIDLVAFFKDVFSSPVFYLLLSYLFVVLMDYNNHPIVKCQNSDGKLMRLGRYITETMDPVLNKNKMLFLGIHGVREVYCDYSFRALDPFCWERVYVIEWGYPHLILTKLKVPEKHNEFSTKIFVKNWKNWMKWILFKFTMFTPLRWLSLALCNGLEAKKTPIKEVDFLIPYISMEAIEYRFNITYKQNELNVETKQTEYVEKSQKNVLYSDIITLQKSNIKEMHIEFANVVNIKYPTLKAAQDDKQSRYEIINSYENRTTGLENQIYEQQKQYQNSCDTIQRQKIEIDERVREGLKPMVENNEFLRNNIPDILSNTLHFQRLGATDKDAIQQAVKKHLDDQNLERDELKKQIAKLESKLELAEKKRPKYNPNEIKITEGEKTDE